MTRTVITTEDVKDLLGHDKFLLLNDSGPASAINDIQKWLGIFAQAGWNPTGVKTQDFEQKLVALQFDQVPGFPPTPDQILMVFKHKKTNETGIYGAFVPSHYPAAVDLIPLAELNKG